MTAASSGSAGGMTRAPSGFKGEDEDAGSVLAGSSASFRAGFSLCKSVEADARSSSSTGWAGDGAMHGRSKRTSFDKKEDFEGILGDFGLEGVVDTETLGFSPLASVDD